MLTVSLLVCAVMALTRAATVPEAEPGNWSRLLIKKGKSHAVEIPISCMINATGSGKTCFTFVPTPMTWVDAERYCQDHGGNLASVHSLNEIYLIQRIILKVTRKYPVTWIGGSDAEQEGSWFWSDSTPFTFNYWAKGQPDNNRGNGHCMTMNFGDQRKFDDMPCSSLNPSVCGKKIPIG